MEKSKFLILALSLLLTSCGYKLANKRYIVQDAKGYLVFREGIDVTFYPFKDTVDAHFLADTHKEEGYKIGYDTYWMDSLSIDYSYLKEVGNGGSKLSILPVEIRCYLGEGWQKKDEKNTIYYYWNNELRILTFKQHDWRNIIHITLLRKSDEERAEKLDIPRKPPHYRQFSSDWPGVNY